MEEERPRRRPLLRLLGSLTLALVVFLSVPAWILGPYFLDDRRLDAIVRVVALDWRDFGEGTARSRLEYELDRARIGLWVRDEDCTLTTEGGERHVGCHWSVALVVPVVEVVVPLSFASTVAVGADGHLVHLSAVD